MSKQLTCEISFVISYGWVDYTIPELDKLDNYEDSHTVDFSKEVGETYTAAFKKAVEALGKGLQFHLEAIEKEISEGFTTRENGDKDAAVFKKAVAEFIEDGWKLHNGFILRKDLGEVNGKKIRWSILFYDEGERYGLPVEDDELLAIVEPVLKVAA